MNRLKPTVLASSSFRNSMLLGTVLASDLLRNSTRKRSILASLALLTVACSSNSATAPTPNNDSQNGIVAGNLEVSVANNVLKLLNTTERPVGYMVVDKDLMVVALFPPCNTKCPLVKQGETASVPFSLINGYTGKSTEAVVMWWKYARRGDGALAPEGAMQTTNVRLK